MRMKRVKPHGNVAQAVNKRGQRINVLQVINVFGNDQQAKLRQFSPLGQKENTALDCRVIAPGEL
ncbi:hypothetical protein D3C73_1383030 [compost metagenome]